MKLIKFFKGSTYRTLKFTALFAILLAPFMNSAMCMDEPSGKTEHEQKKADEEKKFTDNLINVATKAMEDRVKGLLTPEQFEKKIKAIKDDVDKKAEKLPEEEQKLFDANIEKLEGFEQKLNDLTDTITGLGESGSGDKRISFKDFIANCINSDSFKSYSDNKHLGKSERMEAKTVDMSSDYTGSGLVSDVSNTEIVLAEQIRRIEIEDLLATGTTDKETVVYRKETDWVEAIVMEAENGELNESSFKIEEATADVKRTGTFIKMSKRMLRSVPQTISFLQMRLPAAIRRIMSFELLWGDGTGNHHEGVTINAQEFDLTPSSGIAGTVSSIASYKNGAQTLVTFTSAHDLQGGELVKFLLTTGGTYNFTYSAIWASKTQIVIKQTYAADASVANWTYEAKSPFYRNVQNPNELDVLSTAMGTMNWGIYEVTGIAINPLMLTKITALLKNTQDDYLNKGIMVERINGVIFINNAPVSAQNSIDYDSFVLGDWKKAAQLFKFTPMALQFADDVSYKLKNEVAVIIEREDIFPIYNPNMFMTGDFTTAIEALTQSEG